MKRIALFAKRPVEGRVKTRLSPALPSTHACEIYAALLADTIQELGMVSADARSLWWADAEPERARVALPAGWSEATQHGDDLGSRMHGAFASLLEAGARAVIVGADCPTLKAAHIDAAFTALETHDVVFGPAGDGGYYLVGLTQPQAALFEGITWSTSSVLQESLERARVADLRVQLLERLDDLDTPADLVRWIAALATTQRGSAVRARKVLHRLGLASAD